VREEVRRDVADDERAAGARVHVAARQRRQRRVQPLERLAPARAARRAGHAGHNARARVRCTRALAGS